jgi:hypothetical protein
MSDELSIIVDRQSILIWPKDSEEIYRQAVARAVCYLVQRWPRIEICLDKRYTKEQLRYELERYIREEISDLPQKMVLIRQEDSITRKELQATDFIAWAFYQKYERGDRRFYDLIASRVIKEEVFVPDLGNKKAAHPGP